MSKEKQIEEMAEIASKCMTKWLNNEIRKLKENAKRTSRQDNSHTQRRNTQVVRVGEIVGYKPINAFI